MLQCASSLLAPLHTIHRYNSRMGIDVYWARGCAFSWRVLLALEAKGLAWTGHEVHLDLQEQKSPRMLAMNPRGQVPVLCDDGYVVFESLAVLYYLDRRYPSPPIFGQDAQEAGVIMRVINEFQAYTEAGLLDIIHHAGDGPPTDAMHRIAAEARTIESRLARGDWIVGDAVSAADIAIYPGIRLLHQALQRPGASELATRFLPAEVQYPRLAQWMRRMEGLPGYQRTTVLDMQ